MPENFYKAPTSVKDMLHLLKLQFEISVHSVSLGLCSVQNISQKHLQKLKSFCNEFEFSTWTEHLAFVRSDEKEIGHLSPPPRTHANVHASIQNIQAATNVLGHSPVLENIATLFEPPCSELSEEEWITKIIRGSNSQFLLDLHNIYANCLNFGKDIHKSIAALPLEKVAQIHLSGGHFIKEPGTGKVRLLDDHFHDPPPELYELLDFTLKKCPQKVSVILERDGNYPDDRVIYNQLAQIQEITQEKKVFDESRCTA